MESYFFQGVENHNTPINGLTVIVWGYACFRFGITFLSLMLTNSSEKGTKLDVPEL